MTVPSPTPLETVILRSGSSTAYLAPERGGMVTRFFVGDRPVLYLDEATLLDPTKNVRGGNPILFPSPGKLEGDRFTRDGKSGAMGQHGFARNRSWTIVEQDEGGVTMGIQSNAETRAAFPWDFGVLYRTTVDDGAIRIEQHFEGDEMPFGAGFHPYFHVADKAAAHVPTRATRAWDNKGKREVAVPPRIDLTAAEVDLHLLDHGASSASLELGDARIEVRASSEFQRWVIWTLAGKPFVCLEPWTSPGNALNDGGPLLTAQRGAPVELWTEIAFTLL